jgi:hypothetical protein
MWHTRIDMKGLTCGRLKVLDFAGTNKHKRALWQCQCSCAKIVTVAGIELRNGRTRSCGCLSVEMTHARAIKKRCVKELAA